MATNTQLPQTPAPEPIDVTRPRLDRVVLGLLVITVGVGWLLDEAGVSVPWRLLPAVGLVLVGSALIATVGTRRGRGGLIALGLVLLIGALIAGVADGRFTGAIGDREVTPRRTDWPVVSELSAGKLTLDLTRYPLPSSGRLEAGVGAGQIVVIVPADGDQPQIVAQVVIGDIRVDGRSVESGFDVEWATPAETGGDVVLDLEVGAGDIEVRHE